MVRNTKKQILNVAQNLMSEKGYSSVSISDIAKEVGIAKSSLYHFFPDKESLYAEILTLYINNAKNIYKYKETEKPSKRILIDKLKKALICGEKQGGLLVSFENVDWSPEMVKKINKSFVGLYATLYETLKNTRIKNPEFSVHLILDMSYAYVKKKKCGQKLWNTEQFIKLLTKHLYV